MSVGPLRKDDPWREQPGKLEQEGGPRGQTKAMHSVFVLIAAMIEFGTPFGDGIPTEHSITVGSRVKGMCCHSKR